MSKEETWDCFCPILSTSVDELRPTRAAPDTPERNNAKQVRKRKPPKMRENLPKVPETQEEIDAWIAERKKRYPTQQRIAEKVQQEQDREERGALDLTKKPEKLKKSDKPTEMSTKDPKPIKTLIDKLMEDEVRKERSIILQCFRYFVNHNFLQEEEEQQEQNE